MRKALNLQFLPSGVALLTIDLPDSKMNVLSSGLMAELEAQLDELASLSREVKGLVITSAKDDNFIAGANLEEIAPIQLLPSVVAYDATQKGKAVFAKIGELRFPTVAAINGVCLGGGLELALACRYRLASDSPKTKLGLPEVGLGFLPGWGGTVRLPLLVGAQTALELILKPLGTWDSKQAWKRGLVDEVVSQDKLVERAEAILLGAKVRRAAQPLKARLTRFALERNFIGRRLLNKFASQAIKAETKGNYPAPPAALKVVLGALTMPRDKAFELESATFARLAVTPESRNLVGVYFATQESKKAPQNARPEVSIKVVGVLGAGVMGAGIAQSAAYAGYTVVLYDKFPQGLEKGKASITELFDGLVEKRKLTREAADAMLAKITFTTDFAPLADCDIVVEAIVEDLGVKNQAWADVQSVIRAKHGLSKRFIRGSNTSSLKVKRMADASDEPEMFGGLHFFNPVHKMPLVEVVRAPQTSAATVAALKAFSQRIGKTAVTTADAPGFAVNRILTPYMLEAIKLAEAGVAIEDIEKAMKYFGFPMGPFELIDAVGLDIVSKVVEVMSGPEGIGSRVAPPPLVLGFIKQQKLLGKKGGKGLFLYGEDGRKTTLNPDFEAVLPSDKRKKSMSEIQDRLALVMVNEACRCLEEGVVDEPSQLDLAMIMGTGFPPFRGGLLRYADALGARVVHQKLSHLAAVAGENYAPTALLTRKAAAGEAFYG